MHSWSISENSFVTHVKEILPLALQSILRQPRECALLLAHTSPYIWCRNNFDDFSLSCRHPDKNRDSNAEAKFIQIKNAYEVCCPGTSFFRLLTCSATRDEVYLCTPVRHVTDQRVCPGTGLVFLSAS